MKARFPVSVPWLLFLSLAVSGCASLGHRHSPVIAVPRQHGVYDRIVIEGALEATIAFGDSESVEVIAPEGAQNCVSVTTSNGLVRVVRECDGDVGGRSVEVRIVATALREIRLRGAVRARVAGLDTELIDVDLEGASDLSVSGVATRAQLEVSGASRLRAGDLTCESISIIASGASQADIHCTGSFEADASGASNIVCRGDPQNVRRDISGAGRIRMR